MLDCLHVNKEEAKSVEASAVGSKVKRSGKAKEKGRDSDLQESDSFVAMIVAVDVYSRFAVVQPIKELKSEVITKFLIDRIYGTFGYPEQVIVDGGPEFRKNFDKACEDLEVNRHRSIAYHAAGHGKVERLHQTLLSILSKMVVEEAKMKKKKWVTLVPFAMLAYNSAVHSALSQGSTGITPAEAFLGRRIVALPKGTQEIDQEALPPEHLKQNVLDAMRWVEECRQKYDQKMEAQVLKKRGARARYFSAGDLISIHRKLGARTTAKLSRTKDGPYQVIAVPDENNKNTYTVRRVGGTGKSIKVHPDSMNEWVDLEGLAADTDSDEDEGDHEEGDFKVEEIVDEKGSIRDGSKQYK